jgi:hypothetical protein
LPEQQIATSDWPVFAGIDWGGSEHQLCILDTTGTRLILQRQFMIAVDDGRGGGSGLLGLGIAGGVARSTT